MREFVAVSGSLSFTGADREEIYGFVEGTWQARQYLRLSKKDKGVVRRYLATISGRSLAQITRLIRRYRQSAAVQPAAPRRHRFPRRYTADDIALLAAVDAAHEGLSGAAVRRILQREYTVYGKNEYQRLASISASHIYNLRRSDVYRRHHLHIAKTRARAVASGGGPSRADTQPVAPSLNPRFHGNVFEEPLPDIAVQPVPVLRLGLIDSRLIVRHLRKRRSVDQENVQQAVGIIVEKGTTPGHCLDEIAL